MADEKDILLPPAVDADFCRKSGGYGNMGDDEIIQHFYRYGEKRGELASPLAEIEGFVEWLNENFKGADVLEIGPGAKPRMKGERVKYYDRFTTDQLKGMIRQQGGDPAGVPEIAYTGLGIDFSNVNQKFDLVFSCHNLEHIPDPVSHLNGIAQVLKPNGVVAFIIPHRLYTFDHFRKPSSIAEVLQAYIEKAGDRPSFTSWFESISKQTHNNTEKHWEGHHGELTPPIPIADAYRIYLHETQFSEFHRWIFDQQNFYAIFDELARTGLVCLSPRRVFSTPVNGNSFNVIMTLAQPAHILADEIEKGAKYEKSGNYTYLKSVFEGMLQEDVKLKNELAAHNENKYAYLVVYSWQEGNLKRSLTPELKGALKSEIEHLNLTPYEGNEGPRLSRLLHAIWLLRKDLHKYDPETPKGRELLLKWFHDWGCKELNMEFLKEASSPCASDSCGTDSHKQ